MLAGQLVGGPALALAAGAVALWATFVPCFLWIFLAGPHLDRIAARPRLAAAMRGVTAAVVGVILNLSLWFALNVLFDAVGRLERGPLDMPWPQWSGLDPRALGLTALAGLLLAGLRLGLGRGLGAMALAGLALHLLAGPG
jgi:chromate transporter